MAGDDPGEPLYYGAVLYSDYDRIRAVLPALYVYGSGAPAPGFLRRGGHQLRGQGVYQVLHWRVHGGGGYRIGLPDLLSLCLHQCPGAGHVGLRCYHVVDVCGGNHLQYAGAGRTGEGRGTNREGDVGTVKQLYFLFRIVPFD